MTHRDGTHGSRSLDGVRPARRRWRWSTAGDPALRGLRWEQLGGDLRDGCRQRQDELFSALVRCARRDTCLADVVVAALAPGIRARIARYAPGMPVDEAWAVAAGGVCVAVLVGPVPERFVASCLLDAAKRQLQRAVAAEAAWRARTAPLADVVDVGEPDEMSASLILEAAIAAGVVTVCDAWLLHATNVGGHRLGHAAAGLGISYEAAKKRCLRAEARCRDWWRASA